MSIWADRERDDWTIMKIMVEDFLNYYKSTLSQNLELPLLEEYEDIIICVKPC